LVVVRILHLSDTHTTASGLDEDGVASTAALERLLHDCRHLPDLDLVVVSGDVADDGSVAGCEATRDRVGAYAAERGIPVVYCTGNHDDRAAFTKALGSGHLAADGTDVGRLALPAGEERAAVSTVDGLRVITLDSLVPGETPGRVGEAQLDWLGDELATPARRGSIVVLHHPPVHPSTHPVLAEFGLRNPDELAEAITGTDVRAVLCGHYHFQLMGLLAGVPVWVTPGVVTRIDLTSPGLRAVTGAGASVLDLDAPTYHVLHARDLEANREAWSDETAGA
jgi:3',5'-cyclic AMP phosphodiesterase CpdA